MADQRGKKKGLAGQRKGPARRVSFSEHHRSAARESNPDSSLPRRRPLTTGPRRMMAKAAQEGFYTCTLLSVEARSENRSRAVDCHDVPAVRSWRRLVNARRWPPTGAMAVQPTATRGQLPPPFRINGPGETVSRGTQLGAADRRRRVGVSVGGRPAGRRAVVSSTGRALGCESFCAVSHAASVRLQRPMLIPMVISL